MPRPTSLSLFLVASAVVTPLTFSRHFRARAASANFEHGSGRAFILRAVVMARTFTTEGDADHE